MISNDRTAGRKLHACSFSSHWLAAAALGQEALPIPVLRVKQSIIGKNSGCQRLSYRRDH